jgi:hypothetical protein
MDILSKVYEALIADDYIKEQTQGRIKFYEYPATGDVTKPYIVIDPLQAPTPSDYGDNKWTKLDYLLQIDVWTRNRKLTYVIADRVCKIVWEQFGFAQIDGISEKDEGIFRDARRYRGTLYRNDLDSL